MKEVELTPDRNKMVVVVRVDGNVTHSDRFDPVAANPRRKVAALIGIEDAVLLAWVGEVKKAGATKQFTIADPKPEESYVYVRRVDQTRDDAERHKLAPVWIVKDVLPALPVDSILDWSDVDALCCLDIDYHECPAPDRIWLEGVAQNRLCPRPLAWHLSRSGGLHAFYVATATHSAADLASIAALRFRTIDGVAGIELKTQARGPGVERVYGTPTQDEAAGWLQWLGNPEYDETARDEWLASEGMACGERYDHDKCPICPSADPGKHRKPVAVGEAGIYCFVCEGKGMSLGRRRPGWASWAAILGSPSSGDLGAMVRNLTHWGHAKWVLTGKYGLEGNFAKRAYRAALRAYHADKPSAHLVDGAFRSTTDNFARANNLWVTVEQSYVYQKDAVSIIADLPTVQYYDGEKAIAVPSRVCELNQNKDHAEWGYRNLNIVHGFQMAKQFLASTADEPTVAVVNQAVVKRGSRYAPQYVPKTKRMPVEDAWAVIETVFPKIDRTLVTTALAAFACAQETRAGLLPTVFVSGPSGAAKTSTLKIAAGIYGARTHDAVFEPEPAKFRQSIWTGATECPAVICNEILKDSARGHRKLTAREALDPLLNLTPDSASWVAYRGPVRMGRLPAMFLTEPVCPMSLRDETQLARRIRHHRVHGRKDDWKLTTAAAGLSDFHLIRTVSDRVAAACNAILSDVCDTWFSMPMTWDAIADGLGVRTIEDSPDFDDLSPYLTEFFKLVCEALDLPEKQAKVYGGGYKKISRSDATSEAECDTLVAVYTMFADGPGTDWLTSRRLLEKDWSAVLKTDRNVWLDLKNDGVNVYARFRDGPIKSDTTRFNKDIVDPQTL